MHALILAVLILLGAISPARTDTAWSNGQLPTQSEALLLLPAVPEIHEGLKDQGVTPAAAQTQANESPPSHPLANYISAIRAHIYGLAHALPTLPDQFAAAWSILAADVEESGLAGLIGLFAVLAAISFGAQWLYGRATSAFMSRVAQLTPTTRQGQLIALGSRFAHELGRAAIFAAAGIGVFLALDYWPDIIERIVLACLLALIIVLLARAVIRFLLSPSENGEFRIVPMDQESARHWSQRLGLLVVISAIGYATTLSVKFLGFSVEARELVAYSFGLGLLAVGIDTIRRALRPRIVNAGTDGETVVRSKGSAALISAFLVLLWLLWAFGAMALFWLLAIAASLVWAIVVLQRCVVHIMAQPGTCPDKVEPLSATATLLSSGVRFILIMGALLLLAWAWDIDLVELSASEAPSMQIAQGMISAGIILLVADVVWRILRSVIDNQIAKVRVEAFDQSEESQRRSRLSTLLPILRNFLFATLAAIAILMALSAMGIQIGPLIAGAGIAGVAIGFGAQTLVKDILSGVFYLLDDAFRVGEYIESGPYKGTVESFSLRSVKLRNNRGPIFTVPFGILGAVQNMSRDWVIEKLPITITYDSDVEKARKLVKKIGLELAEDPQFKLITIEPLKMQGIEGLGDYGIKLKVKFKTKPGQQSAIRHRALVMIMAAFEENAIKLGSPIASSYAGSRDRLATDAQRDAKTQ